MAKYPIVVIGKWEGAKFENKSEVEDSVLKKYFVTTRFVVEKVIKGEVDPGEQTVSMGTTSVCNPDHPSNKGQGLGK